MKKILGVDCGNVILEQMNGTPVEGAIDSLREIMESRKFESVLIVSKCGPQIQTMTRQWLTNLDFWNRTGIPDSNIEFCLKFREKGPICSRLGITHFVDDRPKVLNCLASVEHLYAFRPEPRAMKEYWQQKPMIVVQSWSELLRHLL